MITNLIAIILHRFAVFDYTLFCRPLFPVIVLRRYIFLTPIFRDKENSVLILIVFSKSNFRFIDVFYKAIEPLLLKNIFKCHTGFVNSSNLF